MQTATIEIKDVLSTDKDAIYRLKYCALRLCWDIIQRNQTHTILPRYREIIASAQQIFFQLDQLKKRDDDQFEKMKTALEILIEESNHS